MPRSPSDDLLPCPFCGSAGVRSLGDDGIICDGCNAQVLGAGNDSDVDTWNRRADQRLAAGAEAEAEANRREDAKSERLAGGAPNANSGSLPPLALAPGGREEPFAWWGVWNKEYVFGKTRDYVEQRLSWIRADFPKTDIVSASPLYLRPQPPSAPQADLFLTLQRTDTEEGPKFIGESSELYADIGIDGDKAELFIRLRHSAPPSPPSGWRPIDE